MTHADISHKNADLSAFNSSFIDFVTLKLQQHNNSRIVCKLFGYDKQNANLVILERENSRLELEN